MKIRTTLSVMMLTLTMTASHLYAATDISQKEDTSGVVTYTTVEDTKLRENPSTEADIFNFIEADTKVIAKKKIANWYEVEVNGTKGYIYKSQLDTSELDTLPKQALSLKGDFFNVKQVIPTYQGQKVVNYAMQFLGNPYVYGGNSLTNGVDCSGFTSQIYKNFGINLQRTSRAQYASNGYKISKQNITPGDLVFYGNSGVVNHVAIYIGGNQIIHASTAKTGIKISKLDYGKPIIGVKRIV